MFLVMGHDKAFIAKPLLLSEDVPCLTVPVHVEFRLALCRVRIFNAISGSETGADR